MENIEDFKRNIEDHVFNDLYKAILDDDLEAIKSIFEVYDLLKFIKRRTDDGISLLYWTVMYNRIKILKWFIKSYYEIKLFVNIYYVDDLNKIMNNPSTDGNTPLHVAVLLKRLEMVKFIVESFDLKDSMKHRNNRGITPLELAKENRDKEMIEYLSGINNNNGNTPLKIDVENMDLEMVKQPSKIYELSNEDQNNGSNNKKENIVYKRYGFNLKPKQSKDDSLQSLQILCMIGRRPDKYIPEEEKEILIEIIRVFLCGNKIPGKYLGPYGKIYLGNEENSEETIQLLDVNYDDCDNWRIIVSVVQNYIRYHYLNIKRAYKICKFGLNCINPLCEFAHQTCKFGENCNNNSCKFIHA